MATGEPVIYQDFSGGVRLAGGSYRLEDNQAKDARDVVASQFGVLEKRRGFDRISSIMSTAPAQLLNSAHTLFPVEIGTPFLLAAGPVYSGGGNDRFVKVATGGTASTITTTPTLTAGKRWEFVQGPIATNGANPDQGPIYGMNGFDTPQQWDGAAGAMTNWTANTGTVPDGTPLLVYGLDKFWASGDPDFPGRVWSTGVSADAVPLPDPCNWDTDFIDDVEPADGQGITAIGKAGPYMLFFKERKMYAVSDAAGRAYRPISSQIGCCAHRSVVETSTGTFFLSEDNGVCVTDGSNVEEISENILPLLREIAQANPSALRNAAGTYHQGSYYLSVPYGQSYNTITLEYNVQTRAWWIHSCASNDFALLDPAGTPKLYSAFPNTNRIDQAFVPDVFTDDDQAYESYWEGPNWAWGNPHINKRVHQMRVDGLGSWEMAAAERFNEDFETLDYDIWEEPGPSGGVFGGPGDFGGAGDFGAQLGVTQRIYHTPIDGWGRAWSIRLFDVNNANPMAVYSVAAFIRQRTD